MPLRDNSAIKTNGAVAKANAFNSLSIKLYVDLLWEGQLSFSYRKISRYYSDGVNGQFKFFIGDELVYEDSNNTFSTENHAQFTLKKGKQELTWAYSFSTKKDIRDLFAEITV